jgi:hypothetical protein
MMTIKEEMFSGTTLFLNQRLSQTLLESLSLNPGPALGLPVYKQAPYSNQNSKKHIPTFFHHRFT